MQEKTMFQKLCDYLEQDNWPYELFQEKYIKVKAQGEDLPITLLVAIDDRLGEMRVASCLPFDVLSNERMADLCVAVAAVNLRLPVGNFICDFTNGRVTFLVNYFYGDCEFDPALYTVIFHDTCAIVDDFNLLLMMLGQGKLSLAEFLKKVCDEEVRA